jgi:hypothetical protein
MKKILIGIGAMGLALAITGIALAEEGADLQVKKQVVTKAQTVNKEQLQLMEKVGGLDQQTIEAMRKQHYGDGEIVIAGALAKASNQPISEIMALRQNGMGWGQIAQKYDLKLGNIMKSVHANINAFEKNAKQTGSRDAINAANRLRNEVQNQERMEMHEKMMQRNQQMQKEMNNMHQEPGMQMNGQHGPMDMHR